MSTHSRPAQATGKASILDVKQNLDAKHKKGHTFPVHVLVKKIESDGKIAFMGAPRCALSAHCTFSASSAAGTAWNRPVPDL